MIPWNFKQYDTNLDWNEIREMQKQGLFFLPSDFIFLGINCNNLSFNIQASDDYKVRLANGDLTSFDVIYSLRKIFDELYILDMYKESDGLDFKTQFLPLANNGNTGVFLIGCSLDNLNQIYYFDPNHYDKINKLNYLFFKQAENIFDLINHQVFNNQPT